MISNINFKFVEKTRNHIIQCDTINCGVYVSHFAKCILTNKINEINKKTKDINSKRKEIYQTILLNRLVN